MFGKKAKILAIDVLNKFIYWIEKNKNNNYIPDTGFEPMYSLTSLKILSDFCQQNEKIANNDDEKHVLYKLILNKLIECNL